jgi:hypothetical protein
MLSRAQLVLAPGISARKGFCEQPERCGAREGKPERVARSTHRDDRRGAEYEFLALVAERSLDPASRGWKGFNQPDRACDLPCALGNWRARAPCHPPGEQQQEPESCANRLCASLDDP